MKIARYSYQGRISYGVVEGDMICPIEGGIFEGNIPSGVMVPRAEVTLLPPIMPGKLVCVGLNYKLHAEESGVPIPEEPMLFMCSNAAVVGEGSTIVLDDPNARIDYEAEIAVVIGRQGRNIPTDQARSYIFGYTICNDVSNRDLQKKDGQFTRAKSFDTYKPLGPWIETEMDPNNAPILLRQNGEVRQDSNTSDMIFPIEEVVAFVSKIMSLHSGDVIITGTPSGVGPMRSGDIIEIEIGGIGTLTNKVRMATA